MVQHIIVREPDYCYAVLFLQNFASFLIIFCMFVFVVLTSIELNTKFCLVAVEVQDESCERMLAAEFPAQKAALSKCPPECMFCLSGIYTQLPDPPLHIVRKSLFIHK